MSNGTIGAAVPSGEDSLAQRLTNLERRVRELASVRSLSTSSIGDGGLRSDNFDGDVDTGAVGTSGWALTGDQLIVGDILLRGGIISDDALASPIRVVTGVGAGDSYSLGVAAKAVASTTVTVPAGFSRVVIIGSADVSVYTENNFPSTVFAWVEINGVTPDVQPTTRVSPDATFGSISTTVHTLVTGLIAGTSIPVRAMARTGNSIPADGSSMAAVRATALFLR